jgi:hypothetical protein
MKNNTKHKITTRKNKPMFHSPFFTLHPSLFTLHPSSFIFHSSFFIILSSLFVFHFSACKDKEPVLPKPDPSNNEYTVKVKIINGTTGKTLYTTSKMHLEIERKYGLGYIDDEPLGSAYMDDDGTIEIKYKHSAMGDMSGATAKLYGGPWAAGFNLPPNQNVDTSIYRSTWGTVVLHLIDIEPFNKIYFAYRVSNDSLISDVLCLVLEYIMIILHSILEKTIGGEGLFMVNLKLPQYLYEATPSSTLFALNTKKHF